MKEMVAGPEAGKWGLISQKPHSPFFKFEQIGYRWYSSLQYATSENMLKSIFKLSSLTAAMALSCSAQNHNGKHLPKGLHGHFGTWYDSGAYGNSPAGQSQSIPFWGSELVLSKKFYLQSFNLTLMNHQPLADAKEFNEFNLHLQWSRQFNKNFTLSLGINNYFYPEVIDSVKAYHELETRIDYTFSSISSYFYVDQELQSNSYTYAALGAIFAPVELGNGLSFTPSMELSAILRAGEVYTEAGLDNLSLAGTLTYQMKESASQFYLILSANRGFSPEREKLALGFTIGLQTNF